MLVGSAQLSRSLNIEKVEVRIRDRVEDAKLLVLKKMNRAMNHRMQVASSCHRRQGVSPRASSTDANQ